jgi:hypothetical protein
MKILKGMGSYLATQIKVEHSSINSDEMDQFINSAMEVSNEEFQARKAG